LANSPKQLERDKLVAEREHLSLLAELGDMRDLTRFSGEYFDLIIATGICDERIDSSCGTKAVKI
jgi:hypothetical protein